jgi:hypothetical protein
MKKLSIAGVLLLSAGFAHAQIPPSNPPFPREPERPPRKSSGTADRDGDTRHDRQGWTPRMTAEIVSADAMAKTITVKNLARDRQGGDFGSSSIPGTEAGQVTLRLEAKARDRVSALKAGDKVTLTCLTDPPPGDPVPPTSPAPPDGAGGSGMSSRCQTVTDVTKSSD